MDIITFRQKGGQWVIGSEFPHRLGISIPLMLFVCNLFVVASSDGRPSKLIIRLRSSVNTQHGLASKSVHKQDLVTLLLADRRNFLVFVEKMFEALRNRHAEYYRS